MGGTAWASVAVSEQTAEGTVNGRNGYLFVRASPETCRYDVNGNLTSDRRWTHTWDGENRLVRMTAATSVGLHLALCDGNGNVAGTVDAAAGTLTAWYESRPLRGNHPPNGHHGQGQSLSVLDQVSGW